VEGAACSGGAAAAASARIEREAAPAVAPGVEAGADEELILGLERDQFVAETSQPVPRAQLGPRAQVGLWALRVFAVVLSAMVVYTFIAGLH